MSQPLWKRHGAAVLMVGGILASIAWAETLELPTYFQSASSPDDLHVTSLTVGTAPEYWNATPEGGVILISERLGIGTTDPLNAVASGVRNPGQGLDVQGGVYLLGGDANVNGDRKEIVDAADVSMVDKYLAGTLTLTPQEYSRADVSGDGRVTRLDRDLIQALSASTLTLDEARSIGKGVADRTIGIRYNGNVGLGTADPQARLHISGIDDTVSVAAFEAPVQVGIGTATPRAALEVSGGFYRLGGNGDVDGNGNLTDGDASMIRAYLDGTKGLTPQQHAQADINGDGRVTILDAGLIDQVVSGALTLAEAHHDKGKRISDRAMGPDLNGNLAVGTIGSPPATSPTEIQTGNVTVNDLFVRAANNGQGQWLSHILSNPDGVTVYRYRGSGPNDAPQLLANPTILTGRRIIGTNPAVITWSDNLFADQGPDAVLIQVETDPKWVVANNLKKSSFRAQAYAREGAYFIVIGEGR